MIRSGGFVVRAGRSRRLLLPPRRSRLVGVKVVVAVARLRRGRALGGGRREVCMGALRRRGVGRRCVAHLVLLAGALLLEVAALPSSACGKRAQLLMAIFC